MNKPTIEVVFIEHDLSSCRRFPNDLQLLLIEGEVRATNGIYDEMTELVSSIFPNAKGVSNKMITKMHAHGIGSAIRVYCFVCHIPEIRCTKFFENESVFVFHKSFTVPIFTFIICHIDRKIELNFSVKGREKNCDQFEP